MSLPRTTGIPARPTLLLAAPYFGPCYHGGAARLFHMLLAGLRDFDPVVYADNQDADPQALATHDAEVQRQFGYRVARGPMMVPQLGGSAGPIGKLWGVGRWAWQARSAWHEAVDRLQPQVIVAGNSYNCGWLSNGTRGEMLRVNYIHGEELTQGLAFGPLSRRLKQEQLRALREADLNIAVSHFSAGLVAERSGAPSDRLVVLPNAVDAQRFAPLPAPLRQAKRQALGWEGRTVLLTVSRLIERKAVDQVLRALAMAPDLPADWLYVVAGTGRQEAFLRALAVDLGLQDRVKFLGFVPEEQLPTLYASADVFIQANRRVDGDTEGFGIVFLESSACGTPVIGGTDGGTADAIAEGVSGLRVDGDDVGAVCRAVQALMANKGLRERMSRQGLQRVREEFTAEVYVRRFEAVISEAWQRKFGPRTGAGMRSVAPARSETPGQPCDSRAHAE